MQALAVALASLIVSFGTQRNNVLAVENMGVLLGNAVVLQCSKTECMVATVAHLCSPEQISEAIVRTIADGNNEVADALMRKTEAKAKKKELCVLQGERAWPQSAKDVGPDGIQSVFRIAPVVVDLKNDYMLGSIRKRPDKLHALKLRVDVQAKTGADLYCIFSHRYSPYLIVFGKMGFTDNEGTIQTQLSLGPGCSGAPVFSKRGLVGLVQSELVREKPAIRITYLVPASIFDLKTFRRYKKNAIKSGRPICRGEKLACEVVYGETSFLDYFGHYLNEMQKKGQGKK